MKEKTDVFAVDRNSSLTMTDQLADAIRQAIRNGRFSEGDVLPPVKEIAKLSGACEMVVRGAIRRLTSEGLVRSRRHVGCIVCPSAATAWRGYVLIVSKQMGTYHFNTQAAILRDRLSRAGFFVSQSFVLWRDGRPDFSQLDEALTHPLSLVVVLNKGWGIAEHIRQKKGVRLLVAAEMVKWDAESQIGEVVRRCLKAGVRRVGYLCMCRNPNAATDALLAAGLRLEYFYLHPNESNNGVEEAELGSLRLFEKKLAKGKNKLPDLIYSVDDYLTRGMLTAFAHYGVRVPEDVRVITFANRGNGPWYFKSLARIEVDPMFLGEKLADRAIRMLDGKPPLVPITFPVKYIDGETFPV